MKKIVKKQKIKPKDDKPYYDDCDDCLVCQAMKFAEKTDQSPTPKELKEVFKIAEKRGAIVGGSLIDEERKA